MTVHPAVAGNVHHAVTLDNTGHVPLHVVTQAVLIARVDGQCRAVAEASWARVRPAAFTLWPGGHRTAHVSLGHVPRGVHDIAVTFENLGARHGEVRVSGAVGSQMLVRGVGHVAHAARPCLMLASPAHGAGPFPWVLAVLLAAVILAAVAVGVYLVNRREGKVSL